MSERKFIHLYTLWERVWHWAQAFAILMLIVTGLEIHAPGWFTLFGFDLAVDVHNVLAALLIADALFGLFYYLTSGTIRQLLPEPRSFLVLTVKQATYYAWGIFHDAPHPAKTPENRLNPLQQATYLGALNALLPLQLVTGLMLWLAWAFPGTIASVGGLKVIAGLHTFGAWGFAAFVVGHVYMTTTGHTPISNIMAMITGYEEVHDDHGHKPHEGEEVA